MCRSVYFAEVGGHADDLRPCLARAPPARGRTGAGLVRCPSAASEAIIAEVVRRDAACLSALACVAAPAVACFERSCVPPGCRAPAAPAAIRAASTRRKWFFSRASEERHALGHLGVADDHARLRLGEARAPRRRPRRTRVDVVAVHALRMPAERVATCRPAARRPVTSDDGPSACWLLTSTMPIRLSSFQWPRRHRRLPDRALVELAVGEQACRRRRRTSCA